MSKEYKEFESYFEEHPDLDNADYYEAFPDVNKSTIRSWKSRLSNPAPAEPVPAPAEVEDKDYSKLEEEHVKLLMQQTRVDPKEFEGLDNKSKILILKNKQKMQAKKQGSGGAILPQPVLGKGQKNFGIDEYITFDKVKNEIRMQIPTEQLFNPELNKKLGLQK